MTIYTREFHPALKNPSLDDLKAKMRDGGSADGSVCHEYHTAVDKPIDLTPNGVVTIYQLTTAASEIGDTFGIIRVLSPRDSETPAEVVGPQIHRELSQATPDEEVILVDPEHRVFKIVHKHGGVEYVHTVVYFLPNPSGKRVHLITEQVLNHM